MRRLLAVGAALVVALLVLVPAALAADPVTHSGRVLVSTQGDVVIPAGDQADVVVVVEGDAQVLGEVNTLVVVDGTATLVGATLETVVAVGSTVEVGPGTVVLGELQRLDSTIHQTAGADIRGGVVDVAEGWLRLGAVLAPVLLLIWLGFGVSTLAAGLLLAGLGARQLRAAERLIGSEPALTVVTGILAAIAIPVVAVLLVPTLIGAPLGVGILLVALPLVAFTGYLVVATWIGDLLLRRGAAEREGTRPYLAVVVGVVVLGLAGLVPILNLGVAVASLVGFGAVILQALRTLVGTPRPRLGAGQAVAAPTGA